MLLAQAGSREEHQSNTAPFTWQTHRARGLFSSRQELQENTLTPAPLFWEAAAAEGCEILLWPVPALPQRAPHRRKLCLCRDTPCSLSALLVQCWGQ